MNVMPNLTMQEKNGEQNQMPNLTTQMFLFLFACLFVFNKSEYE